MKRQLVIGATVGALLGAAALVTPALAEDAPASNLVPGAQLAQVPPPPPMPSMSWTGFYAGINVGYDWGGKTNPKVNFTDPTGAIGLAPYAAAGGFRFPNQSPSGALGGGQVGYDQQFGNFVLGLAADFQGVGATARRTNFAPPVFSPVAGVSVGSLQGLEAKTDWLMTARGRLGWTPGPNWLIYGTGGLAVGHVKAQQTLLFPTPVPAVSFGSQEISRTNTGWAAGAGVEYKFTPSLGLDLDYLHYDLGSARTSATPTTFPAGAPIGVPAGVSVRQQFNGDILRVALNYHFAAAPPPPPAPAAMPAPPPAAPKVFIVFFDWDRDTITREGHQIIAQAADAYKSGAPVQIQVTGYTDRSGSPGYNQRLSERRANNVAKALAARGVPPAQMVVSGRGENDNRVPTADGVREPQNRRVEIIAP